MAKLSQIPGKYIVLIAALAVLCFALSGYIQDKLDESKDFADGLRTEETAQNAEATDANAVEADASSDLPFDLELAKLERIMGDPGAPIKITEHASLTCGHCANFHVNVFPMLKQDYIDTGKAYLVYSDFPLNAPALAGSKLARCVPEEYYFDFIHMLFTLQKEWAYEPSYLNILTKKAQAYGLSQETIDACLTNKELENTMIERLKAVQALYNVNSTPSFVINNQELIVGSSNYEGFKAQLDAALEKINAESGGMPPAAEPSEAAEGEAAQ